MKAVITGSQGFVGRHLTTELSENGYDVHGIDLLRGENAYVVDLLNRDAIKEYIFEIKPDVIFHLAAQASIPLSWENPQVTFQLNVIGTINLLEAIRKVRRTCRLVIIGSADQYGVTGTSAAISEKYTLNPRNPYAASKKAQEEIAAIYAEAHLINIFYTRSFNHCGSGQKPGFLVSDLCRGIVQVERGNAQHLKVGNLGAIRDFTDVRDIVRAYRLIIEKGSSGEIYNIGSGIGRRVQEVLDLLLTMAKCTICVQSDKERMRISDTPTLVCDNTKIREHTGWVPTIPFEQTLNDALEYYRSVSSEV